MYPLIYRSIRLWIGAIIILCSYQAMAEVTVVLEPADNHAAKEVRKRLKTSATLQTAVEFLNKTLITPTDVQLTFGHYQKIWYENHKIEIPYQFIANIRGGYENTRIPHRLSTVDEFTGNTLFHVIFHEMAHALIEQYDLPIVGKEEDAADGLADVLLIRFFEQGDDIVISAADLFYMNSVHQGRLKKEDHWAEHGTQLQRYYTRACHAYGSNPSKHISLKRRVEFSDERAERCIMQYRELERSWLRLLSPALRPEL